eukprot:Awhi_evm1s3240
MEAIKQNKREKYECKESNQPDHNDCQTNRNFSLPENEREQVLPKICENEKSNSLGESEWTNSQNVNNLEVKTILPLILKTKKSDNSRIVPLRNTAFRPASPKTTTSTTITVFTTTTAAVTTTTTITAPATTTTNTTFKSTTYTPTTSTLTTTITSTLPYITPRLDRNKNNNANKTKLSSSSNGSSYSSSNQSTSTAASSQSQLIAGPSLLFGFSGVSDDNNNYNNNNDFDNCNINSTTLTIATPTTATSITASATPTIATPTIAIANPTIATPTTATPATATPTTATPTTAPTIATPTIATPTAPTTTTDAQHSSDPLLEISDDYDYDKVNKDLALVTGYELQDMTLLSKVLLHHFLKKDRKDFEVLEFLGDAILSMLVAQKLFEIFPHQSEGFLSKQR